MRQQWYAQCVKKKSTKKTYRIRNWSEYNKALVKRGSLTIWFDEDVIKAWINDEHRGGRAATQTYTDTAIVCMLTLMMVYSLPLRATQGLMESLFQLAKIDLAVPDYTTLCRRRKVLEVAPQPRHKAAAAQEREVHPFGRRFDRVKSLWRRRMESAPAWILQAADMAQTPSRSRLIDR